VLIQAAATRPARRVPPLQIKQPNEGKSIVQTVTHASVIRTEEALRRTIADNRNLLRASGNGIFEVRVSKENAARAVALLSQIISAAEERGHTILKHSNPPQLVIDGQGIGLSVSEITTGKMRPRGEGDEQHYETFGPRRDYAPTGRLAVTIAGSHARKLRIQWSDGPRGRLEGMVSSILTEAAAHSIAKKEESSLKEQRQMRIAEDHRRRYDEVASRAEEMRRVDFLSRRGGIFIAAERTSSFLQHQGRVNPPSGRPIRVANLLEWGSAYVERQRALCESDAFDAALTAADLFGD
jgi:hypothetical protein